MVLNYIWIGFFVVSFVVAAIRLFLGDVEVFPRLFDSTFSQAGIAVERCLGIIGVITLWLGFLKIAEKAGLVAKLSNLISPFFRHLFPEVPRNHPANGNMMMNFSANMMGLDNAATPFGLKAMKDLQELNPNKEKLSNAQIMFITLNASGLTIIPVSIMADLAKLKKEAGELASSFSPAEVFIPILIATTVSTLVGLLVVCLYQRINLFKPSILLVFSLVAALIGGIAYLGLRAKTSLLAVSNNGSALILFGIILFFLLYSLFKKQDTFSHFIEGAKEGFDVSVKVIPYLVAFMVGIGLFQYCGALEYFEIGMRYIVTLFTGESVATDPQTLATASFGQQITPSLPTAILKPLSGGASRTVMLNVAGTYGVDSLQTKLASIFRGAADTTFYIIALYCGYVGIKNTRYALTTCLLADLAGVIAGIIVAYIFFF